MPTNFPKADNGQRTSPLAGLVDAPAFAKDRAEFAQLLGGDEQAKTFLGDPDAVTKALRDYVWSIGVNGGTGPAASAPAAEGQPVPAATTRAAARPARPRPRRRRAVRLDLTLVLYWSSLGLSAAAVVLFVWLMRVDRPRSEKAGRDQRPHPAPLPGGEGVPEASLRDATSVFGPHPSALPGGEGEAPPD
jgi:hypothetical protein